MTKSPCAVTMFTEEHGCTTTLATRPTHCHGKSRMEATHSLELPPMYRQRALSFIKNKITDSTDYGGEDIRPRTASMPTGSNIHKPTLSQLHRLHNGHLAFNAEHGDKYTVRAFEVNSKGVIKKRSDSMRSRSTASFSSEGEACPLSQLSMTSSSSQESIVSAYTVNVLGASGVGKTALNQQFMTSEYLGGFDTSTERTSSQTMLHIPEPQDGCREKLRCPSPLLGATNNLNVLHISRKRSSSFKKPKEKNLDRFLNDEMRPRTSSMPTRSGFRKPQTQHLKRALLGLNIEPEGVERYTVRSFEMNSKGVIIRRSDSMRSRSTNSIVSSEGDFLPLSPNSRTSSSLSRDSVATSPGSVAANNTFPTRVVVRGAPGCGKTAITQQFMTSEYLGGFDTSIDGETEKTVNVLLNGEETALAFMEQTDEEDTTENELNDNIVAYVIVYACDDRESFDRAVDILYKLRQKEHREEIIIFVGNKSDLVRSRCVTSEEAKAVAITYGCKFIETSVVLNLHVDELLVGIVKQLRLRCSDSSDKSTGCTSSSKMLLNKIFKKETLSQSCENLYR